jgi:hypothetical protein
VTRTLASLIEIGNELLAVKKTLPHGRFGPWLRAEFGWTERTARNLMAVAGCFGGKTEMISEMQIEPTAAYLLAAPSAPNEARAAALERAAGGERITPAVAREILRKVHPESGRRGRSHPGGRLLGELLKVLEEFRRRCCPGEVATLARQLRDFADSLEEKRRSAWRAND